MEEETCYICYEPESADTPFCKPTPCLCKGSIHIHASCLIQLRRESPNCSICKSEYSNTSPGFCKFDEKTATIEFINDKLLRYVYKVNADQLIHGPMKVYYPSGRLHATYEYIYGETNGISRIYYDNEKSSLKQVVRYIAGKMDGELLLYMDDGSVHKRINYKQGVIDGAVYIYDKSMNGPVMRYFRDGVEIGGLPATIIATTVSEVRKPVAEYDPLAGILITN